MEIGFYYKFYLWSIKLFKFLYNFVKKLFLWIIVKCILFIRFLYYKFWFLVVYVYVVFVNGIKNII